MAARKHIPTGTVFNHLTFLHDVENVGGRRYAKFRCICGNEKIMMVGNVRNKRSTSCGCFAREETSKRSTKHGHSKRGHHSRVYEIWANMISRCTQKNRNDFCRYGGRGISVCDRWMKFENFLSDMGEPPIGHSIDRKDNNGNYNPDNCRWASAREQANNRRSNVIIEYLGKRQNIEAWSDELGIDRHVIEDRIRRNKEADPSVILAQIKRARIIELNGKAQTVAQWVEETGLSRACINKRLQKGLPADQVLKR